MRPRYQRNAMQAFDQPLQEHTLETASVRWRLFDTGDKHAQSSNDEVDLYLHGTGSSAHSWYPLIHHKAPARRTLLIDLPGHAFTQLRSPPVRWPSNPMTSPLSLNAMSRSVIELIQQLDVKIHTLVGHSAGAAIACQLCLKKPDLARRIISINGALLPLNGLPGLIFSPIARFSATSVLASRYFSKRLQDDQQIDRLLKNTGSVISDAQRDHYAQLCRNEHHVTAALRMMASWDLNSLYRQLPTLSVETIWIGCELDRMIPPKDTSTLVNTVPHSQAVVIKKTGHLVHEERPDLIAPIIGSGDISHLQSAAADPGPSVIQGLYHG